MEFDAGSPTFWLGDALPGSVEVLVVFVEAAGAVIAFSKVFHQRFEVFGLHEAGDGLWLFTRDDDDSSREFELSVGEVECKFVAAVLRIIRIRMALPIDGGVAFGVDADGIELVAEVLGYGLIRISPFIHLFAPAAPGGIEVDEDRLFLLLELAGGFVDGEPGDGRGGGGCACGHGFAGAGEDHQEQRGEADGE